MPRSLSVIWESKPITTPSEQTTDRTTVMASGLGTAMGAAVPGSRAADTSTQPVGPMSTLPPMGSRVVVVGGGVAGVGTCVALRRRGHDGSITLLDAGDLLHDRPPLSKEFLSGAVDEDALRLLPDAWFEQNRVEARTGVRVADLDATRASVRLDGGERLEADVVVLATGGRARPLPVPGGHRAHVLRTVEDARLLRSELLPGARLVVVGAGLIGAEVVATALALGVEVCLVDPVEVPLADVVGTDLGRRLHAEHARRGARLVRAGVTAVQPDGDGSAVHLDDGEVLVADVVLAGVGMVPDTGLAEAAGLSVDAGVLVDRVRRTSSARVYAVGDACRVTDEHGAPLPSAGHWDAAQRDADVAAADICGQELPVPQAGWFWSDRHGEHVEVVGRPTAGRTTVVRGDLTAGPVLSLAVTDGLVVGAVAVDDPRGLRAARRLLDRRVPVDVDRLADPATDLRSLVAAGH